MSRQPSRDTTAGQVYNDLRKLARLQGRATDELFQHYLLERFLVRLAQSPAANELVLKGGTCWPPTNSVGQPRTSMSRRRRSRTIGPCWHG